MPGALELERAAENLRIAATRHDFAGAVAAARRYAELVGASLEERSGPERVALVTGARELLEWARRVLHGARARLAGQLRELNGAARYDETPRPAAHYFHLEG